jgi:nondiscriminating glutamyl-tRNA synthetase
MIFKKMPVKVRFAPSPTGYLHIGGARTALFNCLYARKNMGNFLLRIEDTDVKREAAESYEKILSDMNWLGLTWDEGPFRQTDRLDIYKKYADRLIDQDIAYYCYCTPEELESKRQEMMAQKITPHYDGTCRYLTLEERERKASEGRMPCLRFKVPENVSITVKDLIRGDVTFDKDIAGDFVIVKSDGIPTYNFAVVIDDHEMGITLVMRGEEHLVNTPKQILIYEALGFPVPEFAHISMILAPDRSKMSKRHGTVAVEEYRNQGFLPEAIINYIALLGWSPEGDREFYTLREMEEIFSLDRVATNPAVYDIEKLKWMNAHYIKEMDEERLLTLLVPYLIEAGYITNESLEQEQDRLLEIVRAVKTRLVLLVDIKLEAKIFFDDNIEIEEAAEETLAWETTPKVFDSFLEVLEEKGDLTEENFMDAVKEIQQRSGAKGKFLYTPLRVAVTGQAHGVEMKYALTLLSKEQMIKRIRRVKDALLASKNG